MGAQYITGQNINDLLNDDDLDRKERRRKERDIFNNYVIKYIRLTFVIV